MPAVVSRITHSNQLFSLALQPGWQWQEQEDGGLCFSQEPPGVLHLSAEPVADPESLPNLSRMLAGFVTRTVRPVATDDLLRVPLAGAEGFSWQYVAEDKACRVWVFGNRQAWVFASFHCQLEDAPNHQTGVEKMVTSLKLP